MKKIIYTLLMTASFTNLCFSQETEFKFVKEGFTDYIVTNCEGKTQSDLYKKTLDWISTTYKNPKEVIKAQIENDYIRIEGFKSNMLCIKPLGILNCSDVRYQIEISFKDGRYKFDVTRVEEYSSPSKYSSGGWSDFPINGDIGKAYFKESGEIRSIFKLYPEALQSTFNGLNKDLENFLKSEAIPSKKGNW
ncbi:DUF4468 domain-containing protein [Flavobacterium psychrophilum]|nr:DUF4468 domain-containing protein [Flavobacterium psychrophilum]ELY2010901.1 DUF4468 domain-containing protein [Flavobacterium psychrophilum]